MKWFGLMVVLVLAGAARSTGPRTGAMRPSKADAGVVKPMRPDVGTVKPVKLDMRAVKAVRADVGLCRADDPDGPAYYAIPLVPTDNLPGLAKSDGVARLRYGDSPFGISMTSDGRYTYALDVEAEDLPRGGPYVVWIATPQVDHVERLGTLEDDGSGALRASGLVTMNKFLIVVTLESGPPKDAKAWAGPIILRGMSRSGMMHTMAGHGPFMTEPCAKFGYR